MSDLAEQEALSRIEDPDECAEIELALRDGGVWVYDGDRIVGFLFPPSYPIDPDAPVLYAKEISRDD